MGNIKEFLESLKEDNSEESYIRIPFEEVFDRLKEDCKVVCSVGNSLCQEVMMIQDELSRQWLFFKSRKGYPTKRVKKPMERIWWRLES